MHCQNLKFLFLVYLRLTEDPCSKKKKTKKIIEMSLKGSLNWHRANLNCYFTLEPEYREKVQSPMS